MIDRAEIQEKAAAFRINTSDVQRDYVFGWFLRGLFSQTELKDQLFLKGGNALRKGYFENTRYSGDLDLGIEGDLDQALLEAEIDRVCTFVSEQTGIVFDRGRNNVREKFGTDTESRGQLKVYEARVYFKDFFGVESEITIKIKMDITRFDKVYLDLQSRPLIHPYSDAGVAAGNIRCSKLEEIVATKLKCLMQREHSPDLFDYVYAVFDGKVALDKGEVVSTFLKKTIFEPSPGVAKKILLDLPLSFARSYWNQSIVAAEGVLFDAESAITRFRAGVEEMFAPFAVVSYSDTAYFPPILRNPILQAGRTQTLLKMVYGGHERLIEPYSLKYKQAQEKHAREYLFAYDLSGGSSGKQGIKSFVAENVQSLENTDTKFTPRENYEIELAKAGEIVGEVQFADPNRPRPLRPARIRTSRPVRGLRVRPPYYGPKFVYSCAACNKKFTKRSMDAALGAHKGRYGGECYGRYGIYVTTKS